MTEQLIEEVKLLGTISDLAPVGAVHALSGASEESGVEKTTQEIKLLKSRFLVLKAKEGFGKLSKEDLANLPPYEKIRDNLNNVISKVKLQKLACDTAQENSILQKYISSNSNFSEDSNQAHFKTELSLIYEEHCKLATRFHILYIERAKKRAQVSEKIIETKQELLNFKNMLTIEENELSRKEEKKESKKDILLKINRLNVGRMLVVNLLCASNINFEENRDWAEILVKFRRPFTEENIEDYTL